MTRGDNGRKQERGRTVTQTGRDTGRVGPEHARAQAELRIFGEDLPTHILSQKVVDCGPGHRLFLAVPRGEAPQAGWPVIYLLDGNAAFDFLTPEHLALVPGLMLVGVGYDIDRQFARERRTLDFTAPDGPGDGIRPDPVHPGRMAGGAAQFLDRLTGPLRAAAEAGLPIDPTRRTLWGHSFGGLFTLYALLTQPGSFARFASISPSIWWDDAQLLTAARRADWQAARAARVLLTVGSEEQRVGPERPASVAGEEAAAVLGEAHMVDNASAFARLLGARGIECRFQLFEGEGHGTVLPSAMAAAARFASGCHNG